MSETGFFVEFAYSSVTQATIFSQKWLRWHKNPVSPERLLCNYSAALAGPQSSGTLRGRWSALSLNSY
jgi:hypothetical protein